METSLMLVWLIICLLFVAGLVVVVVVKAARRIDSQGVRRVDVAAGLGMPDFIVVDCGDQIHFVPVGEAVHVTESDQCPCHPRRTGNRRRRGSGVVYVDHQSFVANPDLEGSGAPETGTDAQLEGFADA